MRQPEDPERLKAYFERYSKERKKKPAPEFQHGERVVIHALHYADTGLPVSGVIVSHSFRPYPTECVGAGYWNVTVKTSTGRFHTTQEDKCLPYQEAMREFRKKRKDREAAAEIHAYLTLCKAGYDVSLRKREPAE